MDSSSGKPTAVHFSLIFFVMTTIVASVVAYLSFKDSNETSITLKTKNDELTTQTTDARHYLESITELIQQLGHRVEDVDDDSTDTSLL